MSQSKDAVFQGVMDRAVLRQENQRLITPTGGNNNWLIDMRRVFTDAALLDAAADLFWEQCAEKMPFQVGGMEVASIPLLAAILMKSVARGSPINGFIVRKERKTYGAGNLIEGVVVDAPIIIVDDILNSGQSIEKVRSVLRSIQRDIDIIYVVIDYRSKSGEAWREGHTIPVISPFKLDDFGLSLSRPRRLVLKPIFQEAWSFKSPDPNFFERVPKSFPVTDGQRVYFGSDCGVFWALDANDGSVIWSRKVNTPFHKNIWSAPALHEGKVFFGAYDGSLYCLDAATGEEIWRCIAADWIGSSPALAPELGLLFVGLEYATEGSQGAIAGFDMRTGEKVWEHGTKRFTHASPAYSSRRKLVACGSNDDELFLFDAATGTVQWRFQTRADGVKGSIRHAPAFDEKRGHVITGCADGTIYIINLKSGKEVWSVQTGSTIYTIPLVVDDLAFVGSTDKYMYILDLRRRKIKHKLFAGSLIFCPPRLINERVYFGACSGLIYEIILKPLSIAGNYQLPDAVTNAITFSETTGLFYVLTYVNQLFALRPLQSPLT